MSIKYLLREGREIWGSSRKHDLIEVTIRLMVGLGDIARVARSFPSLVAAPEESICTDKYMVARGEIQKELGNLIFSTIRFCDDLGFDPEECIESAKQAQIAFAASGRPR